MEQPSKVVIVEDEAIIAMDVRNQLVNSGFVVTGTARTAADAFTLIERDKPDLVLMDIRIKGGMDGIDAAGVVRSRYALPVIYLTAHADDATLERAQITEPYGYVVKPLAGTNLKAVITMALHKHHIERELENQRLLLSATLQGLPDAVIVSDCYGEVLLLNKAAERLTARSHKDAAGMRLSEVAPIEDSAGRAISTELLNKAVAQRAPVHIPDGSLLTGKEGRTTEITGQLVVAGMANQPAGVFITLQDVSVRKREQYRLLQEQKMFVAGELARGVAQEFYVLFDLVDDAIAATAEQTERNALLQRTAQIGKAMALQLMDFRESHGAAHAIDVSRYIEGSSELLQRFGRGAIQIHVSSTPDAGVVMATGSHFDQLLTHLVLDGKQRIGNAPGTITITASPKSEGTSPSRIRHYVRLSSRSERLPPTDGSEVPTDYPFGDEFPDLNLTIIRAIAAASEGFTVATEVSDSVSLVEVFLPTHESPVEVTGVREVPRAILLIGLQPRMVEAVRRAAGEHALLLEAATLGVASLIAELFSGQLDLIILNDSDALPKAAGRASDRIRARRPDTPFLTVPSPDDSSGADPFDPAALERQVQDFFGRKVLPAISPSSWLE